MKKYRLNKKKFTSFLIILGLAVLLIYIECDLVMNFENYVTIWR